MLPLYLMKRNLMDKLKIDDSHFYSAFLNFRFKSSIRKSTEIINNIKQIRRMKIGEYFDFKQTKWFKNIDWKNAANSNVTMLGMDGGSSGVDIEAKLKKEKDKTNKQKDMVNYIQNGHGPLPPDLND